MCDQSERWFSIVTDQSRKSLTTILKEWDIEPLTKVARRRTMYICYKITKHESYEGCLRVTFYARGLFRGGVLAVYRTVARKILPSNKLYYKLKKEWITFSEGLDSI